MTHFILSFTDGICRRSQGHTLEDAKQDARDAIKATGRNTCNVLDEDYKVVAVINSNDHSPYHH